MNIYVNFGDFRYFFCQEGRQLITEPEPEPEPLCHTHEHTTQHLFCCPLIHTTLSTLDLWRDLSGVAALLEDWREKLAANANPHKATETDSHQ